MLDELSGNNLIEDDKCIKYTGNIDEILIMSNFYGDNSVNVFLFSM